MWIVRALQTAIQQLNTTKPESYLSLNLDLLHRFQSINSFSNAASRHSLPLPVIMATPVAQVTEPADVSASAGQAPSLQTQNNPAPVVVPEVAANPSTEGVHSDRTLRSLARQRFEQARLDLQGLYESQGRTLPAKYRALPEPVAVAPVIPTVPHTSPTRISQTAATAPSIVKPSTVGLRSSALAGAGKPSPASAASLASPPGFFQKPSQAGKASRRLAARGLTFASPTTSTPGTHRPVSSDLPYSLWLCDPAGLQDAGYPDLVSAQRDLNKFREWDAVGDSRRDLLLARLIAAGLDPEQANHPAVQASDQVALSVPDSAATGPSGTGPPQPAALLAVGGDDSDSDEEEGPGLGAGAAAAQAVPVPHLDRGILKELPKEINLDNYSSVSFGFTRFEVVTALYNLVRDRYVSLLISLLDQPFLVEFQERTRLLAVHHWIGTQGGTVRYEPLKSVVFKVAAGETCRFSRKTIGALSQKGAGSFDQYLADFETQAAYVQPGTKERLEVFMAGLQPGLRSRVLLQPDGTEWQDWESFLTMCKRHADADLKSRDPPAKVYTITADNKGKAAQVAQPGKRAGAAQTKKAKKAKKNTAANPAAVASASASGVAAGRNEPSARKTIIDAMSKAEGLCSRCLQAQHTIDKDPANPKRCLRPVFKPETKWGARFTSAVSAEMQRTGKPV